jgi:hypothetical protein
VTDLESLVRRAIREGRLDLSLEFRDGRTGSLELSDGASARRLRR